MEAANEPCNLILIVDDDQDVRELLAMVLESRHYRHIEAANGEEALNLLHSSPVKPCVILLDIMMPIMDGWHFRIHQRRDPVIADIPVVALTAYAPIESVNRRMRPTAVIRKPFVMNNLLTTIERFCHA